MSYRKPRPLHRKADPKAQAALKKLPRHLQKVGQAHPNRRVEIWFQDESRFGQQGSLTHVWAQRGSQPRRWRQTEYKWVYLFGAACPSSGEAVGYLMPTADTFCMNLHLAEISRSVAPDVQVALVLDGAGWHGRQGLRVPDNITLLPPPPYSPELNPMEPVGCISRVPTWPTE